MATALIIGSMRFVPEGAGLAVLALLKRLATTKEQLDWLAQTVQDRVPDWPGTAGLRGLFCTRFKPADNVDVDCTVAGFTAIDNEGRYLLEAEAQKPKLLESGKEEPVSKSEELVALIANVANETKMPKVRRTLKDVQRVEALLS